MATNMGRCTYDMSTSIRSTRAKDMRSRTIRVDVYSPCATDTGKQGELDLCRDLHIGIGLAAVLGNRTLVPKCRDSSAPRHFGTKTFRH